MAIDISLMDIIILVPRLSNGIPRVQSPNVTCTVFQTMYRFTTIAVSKWVDVKQPAGQRIYAVHFITTLKLLENSHTVPISLIIRAGRIILVYY